MNQDLVDLRGIGAVLRRRWRLIAIIALAFALVAFVLSVIQPNSYKATASVEVAPLNGQAAANGIVMQPAEIATQMALITSTPVAERVIKQFSLTETPGQLLSTVSVSEESDTRILDITAHRPLASQASDIANAFAEQYLSYRYDSGVAQAESEAKTINSQADRLRKEYDQLTNQIKKASSGELQALQNRQQAILVQLTQVLNAQAQLAASAPTPGAGGSVVVPATAPKAPASPKPIRNTILGFVLGLVIGTAVAFVRDYLDDGVRDERRLREIIAPKTVLGRIPVWGQAASGRVASLIDPASSTAEAYRALGSNVRFLVAAQRGHHEAPSSAVPGVTKRSRAATHTGSSVLITSALPAEGKTDVAANLAVALQRYGLRVVVVDADLRLPRLSLRFGLGQPPGLSDFLAGDDPLEDYLIDVDGVQVLPGGNLAPNPAELLASYEMAEVIKTLTRRFDIVLVDSTPLLRVADTHELVRLCDVTMVVARYGVTRRRSLLECLEQIRQVGGAAAGAVLVGVPAPNHNDHYGQAYEAAMATNGSRDAIEVSQPVAR